MSTIAVAFWLFIGAEYVIPVSKNVKNARRNVPLGMMIGLALICLVQSVMVLGFHNYTPWAELENSAAPHLLYGGNLLGNAGKVWMSFVSAHCSCKYTEFYRKRSGRNLSGNGENEHDASCFCKNE